MLRGGADQMALLYGDLDPRDAGQIVDQLDRQHIPYQVGAGGARSWCPPTRCRSPAAAGARTACPPAARSATRSSIAATASVHQPVPAEDQRDPRAGGRTRPHHPGHPRRARGARASGAAAPRTVRARAAGGAGQRDADDGRRAHGWTSEGVQAILNLVAAAVPGLRPQNIALVDCRGDLLARAGQPVTQLTAAATRRGDPAAPPNCALSRAVEEMLERSLGPGHVRAEAVGADGFRQGATKRRSSFDPDGQVTRSTQTRELDTSKTTEASHGRHRVQNNLPNADAGMPAQRLAGRPPGGDDQLRNRQDGPHADPRAAADRPHQPRGDGGRHRATGRRRQARLAAALRRGAGPHHRAGEVARSASTRSAAIRSKSSACASRRRRRRPANAARLLGLHAREARLHAPGADRAVRRDRAAGACCWCCGRWCCA